jgi:hypothetical protein
MLSQPDDKQICSGGAEKGDNPLNFFGFDQMACYLNGMAAPFGDGGLHEFLVTSPPIGFEAMRHIWINREDQSGIDGWWLNNGDRLQGCAKQLAELNTRAQCITSGCGVVIGDDDLLEWIRRLCHWTR